jgi:hypothetical protein
MRQQKLSIWGATQRVSAGAWGENGLNLRL